MTAELTDEELISRCLKGDSTGFAPLVQRYQNLVYSVVLRYITNRADAEEIAQDVFVKAYRSLADFRGTAKFSTWLYTIANTTCLSFLRKKNLDVRSLDAGDDFGTGQLQGGFPANTIEQKSKTEMLNRGIAMLHPDDAQVLTLFYKGEQSLEEIAQIVGKEPGAVKVQLHRARTKLKEKLTRHFSQEVKDIYL